SGTLQTDSVRQIVFSFYNDQLSKMAVDYNTARTAGMTNADMIDAISTTYGPPSTSAVTKPRAVPSHADDESGTPVARWGDADHSALLYRSTYPSRFATICALA